MLVCSSQIMYGNREKSLTSSQWNQQLIKINLLDTFSSDLVQAQWYKISFHLYSMEIRDTTVQVKITFSVENTKNNFHTLIQFPAYFLSIFLVQQNSYICLVFVILNTY